MVYAFISYSHHDVDFVRPFVGDLRRCEVSYWRDSDDLPPWEAWDDEIERVLRGTELTHLLYFHSASARSSDNVKNEIALALETKRIKIVVLRLDDAPVPLLVYRRTYIDFRDDYGAAFERLLEWLRWSAPEEPESQAELLVPVTVLEPTQSQRVAAQDGQHQRVRIIAGPGTGKSFVVEERVRWLLNQGVSPKRIFVVSFTRAASDDLRRRVARYCFAKGQTAVDKVSVSTLHSLALRVLKRSNALEMYPSDPVVLSNWELEALFDKEYGEEYKAVFERDKKGNIIRGRVADIRRFHEALWSTGDTNPVGYDLPEIEISDAEKESFKHFLRDFSGVYSAVLPGELVAQCVELSDSGLLEPSKVLGVEHFIVDEMQDLNHADNRFIDAIAASEQAPVLYVLGDDDQSVYAFRFAYPQGIQNFKDEERYPDAKDYVLSECFRCTPDILRVATSLIQANHPSQRLPKDVVPHYRHIPGVVRGWKFGSEQSEARFIAESCRRLIGAGVSADDILVLIYSTPTQQGPLEKAFQAVEDIDVDFPPAKGLYFSDAWMAFLYALVRVACDLNLTDYIAHRLLLEALPGVGIGTCIGIKNKVITHNLNYLELFYHPLPDSVFSTRERTAIRRVVAVLETIREWQEEDTLAQRSEVIHDLVVSVHEDPESEPGWLEFASSLPEEMTIKELYSYLGVRNRGQAASVVRGVYERLGLDIEDGDLFKPRVRVMTMHSAKGLNAKVVFIPGLENKIIPGDRRRGRRGLVHEAARLLYVSITRASAACVMTFATSRMLGAQREYGRRGSDFIRDLGERFYDGPEVMCGADVEKIMQTVNALADTSHSL